MAAGAAATAPKTTTTTAAAPIVPPPNNQRPLYRFRPPPVPPQKIHHRSRKRCCILFRCCFFTILILLLLLLLLATACAVFYILYRPHRPTVTINSLRFAKFNLTTNNGTSLTSLTSTLTFIVTVTNPNDKIEFIYDQIWLQATLSEGGIDVGDGLLDGFVSGSRNATDLSGRISKVKETVTEGSGMRRKKKRMGVEIEMKTRLRVRIGRVRTKRIKIGVSCRGEAAVGKAAAAAVVEGGVRCRVHPVLVIVNWNIL